MSGSELRRTPIVKAVQRARPSVVNIQGEKTLAGMVASTAASDVARRVNGMGTGVVIDPSGYIVTNHHVIDGVREILVTTADEKQHVARLISRDPETDLAIIKIDVAKPLPVIRIGTSADLMPGEPVVAVGNAYGYPHTTTRGIISALNRAVRVSDEQHYDDLIQTDASINPGNSGGPLLNIDGEMIGVNVAVRAGAQGIGFAIPVDKAVAVAADLLAADGMRRAWHGVTPATGTPESGSGLVVRAVAEQSPAEEAGLKPGDVLTAIGDLKIDRRLDFHRAILGLDVGESISVSVRRGDETLVLKMELAKVPDNLRPAAGPHWELLGLQLKPIPTAEFQKRHRTRYRGGLTVAAVRPRGPAAAQGIRSGDVLVGMHIWETVSLKNVDYVVSRPDLTKLNPVKFYILRGNETLYGYLP
ncbi:MAG: trypsin-like peptidase domain-containing protein, partial [Planctomycetes bacterium]|nr:trypsin-like peptidase domain-containing protein [Planctomycetota bacterium]